MCCHHKFFLFVSNCAPGWILVKCIITNSTFEPDLIFTAFSPNCNAFFDGVLFKFSFSTSSQNVTSICQ